MGIVQGLVEQGAREIMVAWVGKVPQTQVEAVEGQVLWVVRLHWDKVELEALEQHLILVLGL
jgi:hypothetical protein